MRENEPVLLVFSAYEVEIILEKGEILCEKRQSILQSIDEGPSQGDCARREAHPSLCTHHRHRYGCLACWFSTCGNMLCQSREPVKNSRSAVKLSLKWLGTSENMQIVDDSATS